jgi:hypothetical protein
VGGSPEALRSRVRNETSVLRDLIKQLGIKTE